MMSHSLPQKKRFIHCLKEKITFTKWFEINGQTILPFEATLENLIKTGWTIIIEQGCDQLFE